MLLLVVSMCVLAGIAQAQFYFGANLGFRAYALKGAYKVTQQGNQTFVGNVADAGKTGFNFGVTAGYQVLPASVAGGWYKLDVNLDATYTSVAMLEKGFDNVNGSGQFAASGLSGGSTSIFSFDIMPIHRLSFPSFKLLSPYAGLGLGINVMSTKDITVAPPSTPGTLTGNSETKMGLLIFYGVVFRATDMIQPFLQFKHLIPFGDLTEFTQSYQATGGQAGGTQTLIFAIQDVPSYFNISGGVRIVL